MTFEELKAEANRQGYNLLKRPDPMPKLSQCTCGRKQIGLWNKWFDNKEDKFQYGCPKCGRQSGVWAKSVREARLVWNDMIEKEKI